MHRLHRAACGCLCLPNIGDAGYRALADDLRANEFRGAIFAVLGLLWSQFLSIAKVTDPHLLTACFSQQQVFRLWGKKKVGKQ